MPAGADRRLAGSAIRRQDPGGDQLLDTRLVVQLGGDLSGVLAELGGDTGPLWPGTANRHGGRGSDTPLCSGPRKASQWVCGWAM